MATSRLSGSFIVILLSGILACVSLGCRSALSLGEQVQGMVTVDGKPLVDGLVTLVPIEGTPGGKVSVRIADGEYSFEQNMRVFAGTYRVEVFGMPPAIAAIADGKIPSHDASSTFREVSAEFNEKSLLRLTVNAGELNRFDCDVRYARSGRTTK